ncbi:malto-oligosyltrehalose trehalohydrolase (plasmid) [Thioclava sp. 'Guangxiensis']|uniref:malto-oligosyltrehalose trehalohydrolase n=1 Tax=Thioclava sp. 'Guangxiensis' TaxID=3149044 RepID=UPI0032C4435E
MTSFSAMHDSGLPNMSTRPPEMQAEPRAGHSWGVRPVGVAQDGDLCWSAALWAPEVATADLVVDGARHPMTKGADGVHRASVSAKAGRPYGFDVGQGLRPDPAARAQMGDVHGPSRLSDPQYDWPESESHWAGRPFEEAVILELHIGLFTPQGTFRAAIDRLPELAAMGITAIEIMPVAQFSGVRGWGYDGVLPFAPHNAYGPPEDLKALVAQAHRLGLAVILDVVYNHFGPDGAYLHELAPAFFDPDRSTPWGAGINYSQPAVRAFFLENVAMWIGEFHLDGLRIDAAHQIKDHFSPTMLEEIAATARACAPDRGLWLILEDERNLAAPYRPEGPFDAQWNDDYHHALHCLLTGEDESYYAPFAHAPLDDLVTALGEGQVDQGQPRPADAPARGVSSGHLPPRAFVVSNQTHDQVGNRGHGERLISLVGDEAARVAHGLLLVLPFTPMLFMGEEAGETAPFCFFADFPEPMAEATRKGRQKEFERFASFSGKVPDPISADTFRMSRPYQGPALRQKEWGNLTGEFLAYRHAQIVPLLKASGDRAIAEMAQITAIGPKALHARWALQGGVLELAVRFGPQSETPSSEFSLFPADLAIGDWQSDPCALRVRCVKEA